MPRYLLKYRIQDTLNSNYNEPAFRLQLPSTGVRKDGGINDTIKVRLVESFIVAKKLNDPKEDVIEVFLKNVSAKNGVETTGDNTYQNTGFLGSVKHDVKHGSDITYYRENQCADDFTLEYPASVFANGIVQFSMKYPDGNLMTISDTSANRYGYIALEMVCED